jgi:hypothetical protein
MAKIVKADTGVLLLFSPFGPWGLRAAVAIAFLRCRPPASRERQLSLTFIGSNHFSRQVGQLFC